MLPKSNANPSEAPELASNCAFVTRSDEETAFAALITVRASPSVVTLTTSVSASPLTLGPCLPSCTSVPTPIKP